MMKLNIETLYVSMPEEVSWLLNLKATGQHEFDPLFNSSLLLFRNASGYKIELFIDD